MLSRSGFLLTDAFNSAYWSFEQCLEWARANEVHHIKGDAAFAAAGLPGLVYRRSDRKLK